MVRDRRWTGFWKNRGFKALGVEDYWVTEAVQGENMGGAKIKHEPMNNDQLSQLLFISQLQIIVMYNNIILLN